MVPTAPRFQPISGGTGTDYSASVERASGSDDSGDRSRTHWGTRVATWAVYHTYRWRIALLSSSMFLAGTGFTIYNAAVGR